MTASSPKWTDVEVLNLFGETTTASQETYNIKSRTKLVPGSNGYGVHVDDDNASTGGTSYGLYVNLDDPDTTKYGIYLANGNTLCLTGSGSPDCRNTWAGAGGSSILATFQGGRTDLCDYCSQTNVSGSLTAPASGMLTLDYTLLMESNYCGIIISTYVDGAKVKEENIKGCYGPIDSNADGHGCDGADEPGQVFTYKTTVGAGSHSFWVNGWTGGGDCNSRAFQIKPAYFQWQP